MDFARQDYNNIVITGFNNYKDFFARGLDLIAGIHRTSIESVDQIFVFNLGFDDEIKRFLNSIQKVTVLEFPDYLKTKYFPEFLKPNIFAWKCYALWVAKDLGKNVLWLDSGIVPLKDIKSVFQIIEREEYFNVSLEQPLTNKAWTTPRALELMHANEKEINDLQISMNIFGYKSFSTTQEIINNAFEYAKNKEIMEGDKTRHRHDQSVFSILTSRYNRKRYPLNIYAEARGILSDKQLFYAHRGRFHKLKGLKYKPNAKVPNILNIKIFYLYIKLTFKKKIRFLIGDFIRIFKHRI